MRFLICPDSFKESLSAIEVANSIRLGINKVLPEDPCLIVPLSDGGDGALELLKYYTEASRISISTKDPLNRKITSSYLLKNNEAWIALSESSGLHLLTKAEQNCLDTSTYGTGQLIKDAYKKGAIKIHLFLGGSATNDGGLGILQAFGWKFLDKRGTELPGTGQSLRKIHSILPGEMLKDSVLNIHTDVTNPLLGIRGAVNAFASQKGAKNEDLPFLESGLKNLLKLFYPESWNNINMIKGIGAAGGASLSIKQLANVKFSNGFKYFAELSGLKEKVDIADIVITGEGHFNQSSMEGKVCGEVIKICQTNDKMVIGLFGGIDNEVEINYNKFIGLNIQRGNNTLEEALSRTKSDLQYISIQIAKLLSYAY